MPCLPSELNPTPCSSGPGRLQGPPAKSKFLAVSRETFFGPLIEEVEGRIKKQLGDAWDRDHRDAKSTPIYAELYDHRVIPTETKNIAAT